MAGGAWRFWKLSRKLSLGFDCLLLSFGEVLKNTADYHENEEEANLKINGMKQKLC